MPPKGSKMPESAKKRISESLKDYFKINSPKKHTEAAKAKISKANSGKVRSTETKENLSRIMKERLKDPANHPQWKGGRSLHGKGYIKIRLPEHPRANKHGYVLEHIAVWEKINGIPVPEGMSIHHLNGIKDDNRPENLQAMDKANHIHRGKIYYDRIRELEAENRQLKTIIEKAGLNWPEQIQEFPGVSL